MFTSASVSPEGTLAAANDYDDMTTVWETSSGSSRFTVTDKTFSLVGMIFSSDRKSAVSLHGDHVQLWNTTDGSRGEASRFPSPTVGNGGP